MELHEEEEIMGEKACSLCESARKEGQKSCFFFVFFLKTH